MDRTKAVIDQVAHTLLREGDDHDAVKGKLAKECGATLGKLMQTCAML